MEIVIARPPMFEEIDATFNVAGKPILFAWGDKIYNPENAPVTRALQAHEYVHGTRQGHADRNIEAWWKRYIADPQFRLEEEIPAHRAEYQFLRRSTRDRNRWNAYLVTVAGKLASPLYGKLVTDAQARQMLRA
ncbi:MAG TPA: hypothetical protein VF151_10825 [Gemmatimonadales bacterium]